MKLVRGDKEVFLGQIKFSFIDPFYFVHLVLAFLPLEICITEFQLRTFRMVMTKAFSLELCS